MVASIETTLELWASTLRDVKRRLHGLFAQERSAANAESFLDGLLGDERRKFVRLHVGAQTPRPASDLHHAAHIFLHSFQMQDKRGRI